MTSAAQQIADSMRPFEHPSKVIKVRTFELPRAVREMICCR